MKRKIYLSLLSCLFFLGAWSQTRQVYGLVLYDSTPSGRAGVNVTVKGPSTSTASDRNGHYAVSIPDKSNAVLVFSFIGFTTQEVAVGSRTSVNITLSSHSSALD